MPFYEGPGLAKAVNQALASQDWGKNQRGLLERARDILKERGPRPFEIRRRPEGTDITLLRAEGLKTTLFAWPQAGGWRIEKRVSRGRDD